MTTANIVFLIDIQNGFAKDGLSRAQGGSLYVPGGEGVGEPAARLIDGAKNTIFVLSADFHRPDIISDSTNHRGIMELRHAQAKELGVNEAALPFTNIYLREDAAGVYKAVGVVVGDEVRAVTCDKDGYIEKVGEAKAALLPTDLFQTLWSRHCVQGTLSALFVPEIMDVLPQGLAQRLYQHDPALTLVEGPDGRGNIFYVIHKGMRRDVDSNAIALENNQKSFTSAPQVFEEIAEGLSARGVKQVKISLGGLAGNICAELSHNDVHRFFLPLLKAKGMEAAVSFMKDISPNVPIAIPGGVFPDAGTSLDRMAAFGTNLTTTEDVMRTMLKGMGHTGPKAVFAL